MLTFQRLMIMLPLTFSVLTTGVANEVAGNVQSNICVNVKNNRSDHVFTLVKKHNVTLKRDFNNIHCKSSMEFEGGNLYQVAVHYQRFGMMDSFIDEHHLDINLIDTEGRTILDWVDFKINHYKEVKIQRQETRYQALRKILVGDYEAKTRAQLEEAKQ